MTRDPSLPRPRKRFGQHFLEPVWAERLTAAIAPQPADIFVEIGPGGGALTWPLAQKARHVAAFEIDRDLAAHLRATAPANVLVVEGDFLEITPAAILAATGPVPARIAGNLPYNVASPILFRMIDLHAAGVPLLDATVMLQREVADRLVAAPGSRDYGVLSVLIRRHAAIQTVLRLPPGAFRPAPKVHSAVVRLSFHPPAPVVRDEQVFRDLTGAIFTRRRKTLANALLAYEPAARLGASPLLAAAGIDGRRRPETLDLPELGALADAVVSLGR